MVLARTLAPTVGFAGVAIAVGVIAAGGLWCFSSSACAPKLDIYASLNLRDPNALIEKP